MQNKKIITRLICRFFRSLFGFANPPRVRFYIDGFNFYYGIARRYKIKWIDMEELLISIVREKIPNAEVEKIFIFTAPAKDVTPGAHQRQQIYFSALKEKSSCITIIKGEFYPKVWEGEKTQLRLKGREDVKKIKLNVWEEKKTDVNLGCKIVEDAHTKKNRFDICCLVSNDRDFSYPLEAKKRLKQRTLLITPRAKNSLDKPTTDLTDHISPEDQILYVNKKLVESCQLPDEIDKIDKVTGKVTKYHIPAKWKLPKPEKPPC